MEPEKVDLAKMREMDKLKPKKVLTEEDKLQIQEQKELGKLIDNCVKREQMLVRNKKLFHDDPSLFLYRLPINNEQMKKIHRNLIKSKKKM
jgi:hypothetical protein